VRFSGAPILLDWSKTPHIAVLGASGSGKSTFLQLLAFQAIRDGMQLLASDLDQTTLSRLNGHPALLAPVADSPAETLEIAQQAVQICDERAGLFAEMDGHPENIDEYNRLASKAGQAPLPRVLVLFDETSAVLTASGGGKGNAAQLLATLGYRGRKFGVHFVFGVQEFTKDILGPVREQVHLVVAFRVLGTHATLVKRMGCAGAERIPHERVGLAITDRHGPMQAYFVDKSQFAPESVSLLPDLTDTERVLFRRAVNQGGKLGRAQIMQWSGATEWQARKWLEQWAVRGWVMKDPNQSNAFAITQKTLEILSNHPTPPTVSNRLQGSPTRRINSPTALPPSPTGRFGSPTPL
jgi:energy-coupling factor transporter ATP-binding protein EcfA2